MKLFGRLWKVKMLLWESSQRNCWYHVSVWDSPGRKCNSSSLTTFLLPPWVFLHPFPRVWELNFVWPYSVPIPYTRPLILLTGKSVISRENSPLRRHFFPVLEQCTVHEPLSRPWLASWGKGNPVPLLQWPGWPLGHCVCAEQTDHINLCSVGGSAASWSRSVPLRAGWPSQSTFPSSLALWENLE